MLGAATLTETGLNGSVFQMFAHGIMTGLFFALVGLVYEKAHSREIVKMGGFGAMMPGIATAFTIGGLVVARPAGDGRLRRRVPDLPRRLALRPIAGGCFAAVAGAFLTSIYVLRVAKQIFWGPPSPEFHHFAGPAGARTGVGRAGRPGRSCLVLFGMVPGIAHRARGHRHRAAAARLGS